MNTRAALVCTLLCLCPLPVRAAAVITDGTAFRDEAEAQAAWRPMRGSAPATAGRIQDRATVRLRCNFAGTTFERASWDRAVVADLGSARGIEFEFFCPNLDPVSQFSIYFQSGGGWYSTTFQPEVANAWCNVKVRKNATRSEGEPAGWNRISTIRVSAWRGQDVDTEIAVRNFRAAGVLGADAAIAVLRADSVARARPGEARSVEQFTESVAAGFESFGVACATPSDADVTTEQLRNAAVVVLPYNPSLPAATARALVDYIEHGGRLLAFYLLPPELAEVAGIVTGRQLRAGEQPGGFAAIRTTAGGLDGAPALVKQRSANIREARPASGAGRVLAEWLDEQGRTVGHPGIIGTPNCVLMTHVLQSDDLSNQRRLLLAMAGRLVPDLWRDAARTAVARIGEIGGAKDFEAAAALIRQMSRGNQRVAAAVAAAQELREAALQLSAAGRYAEAIDRAPLAGRRLMEAYCLAQPARAGEFRAFWCHSAFGVDGMDWDEAIRRLADAGFTAILPNMLWGGVAYYPSKVLPIAGEVATRGDQVAQCLAAARKYGVQVHVWKVNWNTGRRVPAEFLDAMRQAGRLQMNSKGKSDPWLCPSHPENQALEIASMVEVARNYEVDGLHFDYIRYPDADHCFCAGCRERFESAAGSAVKNWPGDVLGTGPLRSPWLEWRRSNITKVVQAVSEQARAVKPRIRISAAVFRNWTTDRDGVGQDWRLWCERGWLDFVCPMDYTNSERQFEHWVIRQKDWAGRTPMYPGIGVSSSTSRLPADRTIAQIAISRRHDTGGFVIFNYGAAESHELLPLLALGATAER